MLIIANGLHLPMSPPCLATPSMPRPQAWFFNPIFPRIHVMGISIYLHILLFSITSKFQWATWLINLSSWPCTDLFLMFIAVCKCVFWPHGNFYTAASRHIGSHRHLCDLCNGGTYGPGWQDWKCANTRIFLSWAGPGRNWGCLQHPARAAANFLIYHTNVLCVDKLPTLNLRWTCFLEPTQNFIEKITLAIRSSFAVPCGIYPNNFNYHHQTHFLKKGVYPPPP